MLLSIATVQYKSKQSTKYTIKAILCEGKTQGSTEFITLRTLVVPLLHLGTTAQGLRVITSVDPCVSKSNYYLVTLAM